MADLGSIGRQFGFSIDIQRRPVVSRAVYKRPTDLDLNELAVDVTGMLTGVVRIAGVPTQDVHVGLFDRASMNLIAQAKTNNAGAWTFTGLDKDYVQSYFVTILDPREGVPFNYSLTRDHLTAT